MNQGQEWDELLIIYSLIYSFIHSFKEENMKGPVHVHTMVYIWKSENHLQIWFFHYTGSEH